MVSWFTQYPPFKLKTHPCTFLFSGSDVEPKVISHLNCTHWIPRTPSKPCVLFLMFLVFPGHGGSFLNSALSKNTVPKGFGHATWTQAMGLVGWGWTAEISENVGTSVFCLAGSQKPSYPSFFLGEQVWGTLRVLDSFASIQTFSRINHTTFRWNLGWSPVWILLCLWYPYLEHFLKRRTPNYVPRYQLVSIFIMKPMV